MNIIGISSLDSYNLISALLYFAANECLPWPISVFYPQLKTIMLIKNNICPIIQRQLSNKKKFRKLTIWNPVPKLNKWYYKAILGTI